MFMSYGGMKWAYSFQYYHYRSSCHNHGLKRQDCDPRRVLVWLATGCMSVRHRLDTKRFIFFTSAWVS